MARIPYPDLMNLPEPARAAFDSMVAPLNLIRMCAHAPALVRPIVKLGTAILSKLEMPPQRREALILRTAWHTGCEYIRTQHRTIAADLGMTEADMDSIETPNPSSLSETERTVLKLADQVIATSTVDPTELDDLLHLIGHTETVELFVIVGHYRMLSGVLNGLEVDIDPHGEKFAALAKSGSGTGGENR